MKQQVIEGVDDEYTEQDGLSEDVFHVDTGFDSHAKADFLFPSSITTFACDSSPPLEEDRAHPKLESMFPRQPATQTSHDKIKPPS